MRRVLVIEPDRALRRELARSIRHAGWEVQEERSADSGLALLEQRPADAVLVDVTSARDLDAIERVRRHHPHVPLVAMGAQPSFDVAVQAMKRGAADFLRKPFAVGALEGVLAAALAARPDPAPGAGEILTRAPAMEQVLREARVAAASDATVQIVGESGTGKDLLARFLHRHSVRRDGPFVSVNCAALPETLAETELFGHERGAFTGAVETRAGQIAAAEGGTLLLDEVCELSPSLQPKLLRVLQEREVIPVGGSEARTVDLRVVATTQRDLQGEVAAGRFRADLYYRLDVIVLRLPPLRERTEDVELLAKTFLERLAAGQGVAPPRLGAPALARLAQHGFPGNVRELENLMRRAVLLFPGREVDVDRLFRRRAPVARPVAPTPTLNLREIERQTIIRSLAEFDGNRTLAARALGISVRTLRNKIQLYALR